MQEILFNHRWLSDCQFGIVDPASVESLPSDIQTTPMVPLAFEQSAHLMPLVIETRHLSLSQRDELLERIEWARVHEEKPPLSFLVASTKASQEFIGSWNSIQTHRKVNGEVAWFRAHDPRVIHQLIRFQSPAQNHRLLALGDRITYWLRGWWSTEVLRSSASGILAAEAWDWSKIERIGLINRSLEKRTPVSIDALNADSGRTEMLIDRAINVHHLSKTDDLVEFASRGLAYGEAFDLTPEIKLRIVAEPEDDESTLSDRLALIDDAVWQRLAHESRQ